MKRISKLGIVFRLAMIQLFACFVTFPFLIAVGLTQGLTGTYDRADMYAAVAIGMTIGIGGPFLICNLAVAVCGLMMRRTDERTEIEASDRWAEREQRAERAATFFAALLPCPILVAGLINPVFLIIAFVVDAYMLTRPYARVLFRRGPWNALRVTALAFQALTLLLIAIMGRS